MTKTELLQILMGFLGSLGFAVLYNIRGKKLAFASLGGVLSWTLFVLLKFLTPNEALRYFIVAVLASAYAEAMARVLKTPTTTFLITALIPLIPGGSLYYTMTTAFAGNAEGFAEKGMHTLQLSVALALGIVLNSAVTKMLLRDAQQIRRRHKKE